MTHSRSRQCRACLLGLAILVLACHNHAVRGQEGPESNAKPQPSEATQESKESDDRTKVAKQPSPQDEVAAQKRKDRRKQVAWALFGLVALSLAGMVGFAILWGVRTKRIVRQPLPPAPKGEDLWFLKKAKPGNSPNEAAASESHPESPDKPAAGPTEPDSDPENA